MFQCLILSILILIALFLFFKPILIRIKIIRASKGSFRLSNIDRRILRWIYEVLFQFKVITGRPFAGLMHAFVFWGFLSFLLVTLDHFTRGFSGTLLGHGSFYYIVSTIAAVFSIFVIIGITSLAIRRFIFRPSSLGDHLSWESGIVAAFIEILMITYLLSYIFSDFEIISLTNENTPYPALINWWIHTLTILAFLVLIPRSKHLHLLFAPFTTFLKALDIAHIEPLDFEKEEFGSEILKDLGPMTALSSFTCVECGRCMDHCPATNTGKTLNPKQLILDLRKGYLRDIESPITEDILSSEIIWQCTTCGACTFQCPVGVEHVSPIIDIRRGLTAGGAFPSPMKTMFKSLERQGNPWGYPPTQAVEFLKENDYPCYENQDILYWMGCFARYDDRYRKISLKFIDILNESGISWGVLYQEKCTGDSARRAGNEFLFQELAMENISNLNNIKAHTIVSTCPHCVKSLKEYKHLSEPLRSDLRIVHHTTFLNDLIADGKISSFSKSSCSAVYHDACYLSRYVPEKGVKDPRSFLEFCKVDIHEPPRHGVRSFCCGAGGGQFFNEETEGERIYRIRTKELLETGADTIATACPFCYAMIRDGLSDLQAEDVSIKDIVEFK